MKSFICILLVLFQFTIFTTVGAVCEPPLRLSVSDTGVQDSVSRMSVVEYKFKVYITDEMGNLGYLIFNIQIESVYVPSIRVKGLTPGRRATVLKRCVGPQCSDEYIEESDIGEEVETNAGR